MCRHLLQYSTPAKHNPFPRRGRKPAGPGGCGARRTWTAPGDEALLLLFSKINE
jgi:hypothetical protein